MPHIKLLNAPIPLFETHFILLYKYHLEIFSHALLPPGSPALPILVPNRFPLVRSDGVASDNHC